MSVIENLGEFGFNDLKTVSKLLTLYKEGNGDEFLYSTDNVRPQMNTNSGYIWLSNSEHECLMITEDENGKDCLKLHFYTPYAGHEGFLSDLLDEYPDYTFHIEDFEFLLERNDNDYDFMLLKDIREMESECIEYIIDNDLEDYQEKILLPLFKLTDFYNDCNDSEKKNLELLVISDEETAFGLVGIDDWIELSEEVKA